MACVRCSTPLKGRQRRFCSDACKQAVYYAADPSKLARRRKRWDEQNPERRRELRNNHEKQNRVTANVRGKRFRERHPDVVRDNTLAYQARKRGAFVEHVDRLIVLEHDDGVCGICGEDVDPMNFSIDHIVPLIRNGLHCYANVQVAHPVCNSRKGGR